MFQRSVHARNADKSSTKIAPYLIVLPVGVLRHIVPLAARLTIAHHQRTAVSSLVAPRPGWGLLFFLLCLRGVAVVRVMLGAGHRVPSTRARFRAERTPAGLFLGASKRHGLKTQRPL